MSRKNERILWVSTVSALLVVLAVFLLSPSVEAQGAKRRSLQDIVNDVESVARIIQNSYVDKVDTETLYQGAMKGLLEGLDDPYSLYLDDTILEKMNDTTSGKYGGVGLYIAQDYYDKDNPHGRLPYVKVVSPIEDTPSWRAGINAGDYIYAIESESAEGFSTQDVSERLRGAPGSEVKVTILRNARFNFDVTLVREEIEIPTVKTTIINEKIGYLRIIEFTPFTRDRVQEALNEFGGKGVKSLIVDVRSNPGGLLDSVTQIADLFLSGGVVVSTQYQQKAYNKIFRANQNKLISDKVKIVVLIDKGSASASEILTGALKDRGRATVIGETSFGKGSIQQIIPINGAAIKLTTGRYYTPSGKNIDKVGIEPNIEVKEPELTEEQTDDYAKILQNNLVGEFISKIANPTTLQVNQFIRKLQNDGLNPGERVVRMMVRREESRRMNTPPIVDLKFDLTLSRAIEFLRTGK